MIIFYNHECSKCNSALELLRYSNCNVKIRNYLENPPSVEELKELTRLLKCLPSDITRKKEHLFVEKFEGRLSGENDWYEMLATNPILIERPIVIDGKRAVIGRPPEKVLELI